MVSIWVDDSRKRASSVGLNKKWNSGEGAQRNGCAGFALVVASMAAVLHLAALMAQLDPSDNSLGGRAFAADRRQHVRGTKMNRTSVGSGLVCAAAIAVGFGFALPIDGAIGGVCILVAIVSGMICLGLTDGQ